MKEVNIWVVVGLLQLVYGVILLIAGVRQFWAPSATVLANLHASFWAGIILIAFGLLVVLINRLNRIGGRPQQAIRSSCKITEPTADAQRRKA